MIVFVFINMLCLISANSKLLTFAVGVTTVDLDIGSYWNDITSKLKTSVWTYLEGSEKFGNKIPLQWMCLFAKNYEIIKQISYNISWFKLLKNAISSIYWNTKKSYVNVFVFDIENHWLISTFVTQYLFCVDYEIIMNIEKLN